MTRWRQETVYHTRASYVILGGVELEEGQWVMVRGGRYKGRTGKIVLLGELIARIRLDDGKPPYFIHVNREDLAYPTLEVEAIWKLGS